MKFAAKSKFLKVAILYGVPLDLTACNRRRSRPDFRVPGHAPWEIFENQVSQISGNWITDYLF